MKLVKYITCVCVLINIVTAIEPWASFQLFNNDDLYLVATAKYRF